nr:MAG TPA: hypothetical protein [Caudoviricetes sp.]
MVQYGCWVGIVSTLDTLILNAYGVGSTVGVFL